MKRILLSAFLLSSSLNVFSAPSSLEEFPSFAHDWKEIPLTGESSCSRGTPYSFFISQGKTDKVVIDFIGGGACWNEANCAHENKTFVESIEEFKKEYEKKMNGVYNRKHQDNPLREWTHVIVPYCTGDLHWGSNDQTYTENDGTSFVVRHRGAVNAKSVLKWVQDRYRSPEKVLVTGCSAGAYASAYWQPYIKKMYPNSSLTQFGDSGISPITESFASVAFAGWNIHKEGPTWVPGLSPQEVNWAKLQIPYIYEKLMNFHPDVRYSSFTSAFDSTQRLFFFLMGGDPITWPSTVNNTMHTLGAHEQFKYFVSPGSDHCILPFETFYTAKSSDGLLFKEWFQSYISGEDLQSKDCVNCKEEESELEFWQELQNSPREDN